MWWMSSKSWTSITFEISIVRVRIHESLTCKKAATLNMSQRIKSLAEASTSKEKSIVTILACVTRKMLRKEMLDHLDDVEQYYRWW